jgi:hypothetical protein
VATTDLNDYDGGSQKTYQRSSDVQIGRVLRALTRTASRTRSS